MTSKQKRPAGIGRDQASVQKADLASSLWRLNLLGTCLKFLDSDSSMASSQVEWGSSCPGQLSYVSEMRDRSTVPPPALLFLGLAPDVLQATAGLFPVTPCFLLVILMSYPHTCPICPKMTQQFLPCTGIESVLHSRCVGHVTPTFGAVTLFTWSLSSLTLIPKASKHLRWQKCTRSQLFVPFLFLLHANASSLPSQGVGVGRKRTQ